MKTKPKCYEKIKKNEAIAYRNGIGIWLFIRR